MLMRFDPFRELDRLTQQAWPQSRSPMMPMDALRQGSTFVVRFDLPGVESDAIDLTVEKNVLTVTAERSWERSEDDEVVVTERPQGRFSRQLFLGDSLDTGKIEASYDNGVLSVTIPVAEQAKPRKVELSSSSAAAPIDATATESLAS